MNDGRLYQVAVTPVYVQSSSDRPLLLNVLGDGTFLDLLKFVERHAPDAATAAAGWHTARAPPRPLRRLAHLPGPATRPRP